MQPNLTNRTNRIVSIDILRGAIMLIMALDHVRDYMHAPAMITDPLDLNTTTPAIFFTRWITHFCAPIFVFLSGLSAYISGQRKTKKELSVFLIKRGFWLIIVELTIITLALTFNPFYNLIVFQVIWAIGCSMIILGLLLRANYALVVIIGLVLVFGHNIFDYVSVQPPIDPARAVQAAAAGPMLLWKQQPLIALTQILFTAKGTIYAYGDGRFLFFLYAVLPWTGILLLGYAFGRFFANGVPPAIRVRKSLITGIILLGLFILLRAVEVYGDPRPWVQRKNLLYTIFDFVAVEKYPPSLCYTLMTIGTALVLLALLENARNRFFSFLSVYGKVPFFYYVLHFFLVHTICVVMFFAQGHGVNEISDPASPLLFRVRNMGVSLIYVYLIWFGVIATLYYPCRWFVKYKREHTQWWLSYL